MTAPFWKNISTVFKSFGNNAPNDLIQLRKQVSLIAVGQIPDNWRQFLELEPIEQKVKELHKYGMAKSTASRIVKAGFTLKKRSSILDNEVIIEDFLKFLHDNSQLAIRSRDCYRIAGSDEVERARILDHSWDVIFDMFNDNITAEGRTKISKNSLRKIRKAHCKNFRVAAKFDLEYAMCSQCSKIDMVLLAMKKNRYLKDWNITKSELLDLSVCDTGNELCLWNKCSSCSYDEICQRVVNLIPNFENIKRQMINFPELVQYAKANNKSKTTKWIEQVTTINEFASELTGVLFCSKTKATGPKVNIFLYFD